MSSEQTATTESPTNGQHATIGAIVVPEVPSEASRRPNTERRNRESHSLRSWQEKLLPWMLGFLIFVAIFFLGATIYEFNYLNNSILATEQLPSISSILPAGLDGRSSDYQVIAQIEVAADLEAYLLQQRYHQASLSEMSRVWLQYLGFATGMILALVGAFFILGKITDATPSNLDVDWKEVVNASLVTSSPGLVLAAFGVILMIITIVIHHDIKVADAAIYLRGPNLAANSTWDAKTQPPLDEPPIDSPPNASPAAAEAAPLLPDTGN